ncbi:Phosphotransferase enzyme family protein [Pseudomonas cuatrocienegasensis]|uniref:Phosphotransferase enzyme family protein n=1 Tax=Pseudomonas cuatrocienegasensis TaxID=543360 RepID=A0ABY1BH23_9PSED|nr:MULTISPECIES: phosphotransferase [Pseudomonas]OEC32916.1 toluene tolerance protein [Pseudomonas sp. 21C1]SEQ84225.1 Phosphotransferase enzyme family protein [Pseudomonas cuatrocienegasensis]
MRIVTAQQLESWLATGRIVERDARGPKVVQLSDGRFLKIFHTRRAAMLARLFPPALRFARNAELLKQQGIAAPHVSEAFWLDDQKGLSACLYEPLEGCSLEQILKQDPEQLERILPELARFIAQLHAKRIYFRSLHLGNILWLSKGEFGLIDFLDLRRKRLPLSGWHAQRNFRHLEGYLQRRKINNFPLSTLKGLYWAYANNCKTKKN